VFAKLAFSVLLIAAAIASPTSQSQTWFAYSRTAESITGSIVLSSKRLHMTRADFPLKFVTEWEHFETAIGPTRAQVYAVAAPKNPILLNGNRLCSAPVRWIVLWKTDEGLLGMAAFESKQMPSSVKSSDFCGSYHYSRSH
jgi:hypothetical protein